MSELLKVENLSVSYGGIKALSDVTFSVDEGQIAVLVGVNGAGKSTILKSIMNAVPYTGAITFQGSSLSGKPTDNIARRGISLIPEGRHVFANLSVYENLTLGAYTQKDKKVTKGLFDRVYSLFPRLYERSWQKAGTLSGGEQQMLVISRSLMSSPKMILMDEPSLGLAPVIVEEIFKIIKNLVKENITILLVEQNASMALKIADKAFVLDVGKITHRGTGMELLLNESVKKAYLGG